MNISLFLDKKYIKNYIYQLIAQYWGDILIVIALMIVVSCLSCIWAWFISPVLVENSYWDLWFESDIPREFANMIDRWSNHYRTNVHPLFSLIAFPPTYLLTKLGFESISAVRIVIAFVASVWISLLYWVMRLINCRRFDAIVFSLLGAISGAAIFWFGVPVTYSFGSVSMLTALVIVGLGQYRQLSSWWYLGVSALTLSITTTNWMAGILATFVNHRWKQALQITINAFSLVVILSFVQYLIFPSAEFLLKIQSEKTYVFNEGSVGALNVIQSFISHTMIVPAIEIIDKTSRPGFATPGIQMVTQLSAPGSGSLWGKVAVLLWTALLGLGIWGLFSIKKHLKLRIVLALIILGQLVLHLLYGEETFVYSLHFAPFLVILAAMSTLTRARPLALVLAGMLLLSAGINNSLQFNRATESMRVSDHQQVLLPAPSNLKQDQGYHRLGGSFSPPESSFGISFWIRDQEGNLQTTSDNIASEEIRQKLVKSDSEDLSGIETSTNYYEAFWSVADPGKWQLHLKTPPNSDSQLMIAIRSVGGTRGEIRSLDWDGQRLLINQLIDDRWLIKLEPSPTKVYLGKEKGDWMMTQRRTAHVWEDWLGLGYALFALDNGNEWNLTIEKV